MLACKLMRSIGLASFVVMLNVGCGDKNLYQAAEKGDTAEDAAIQLERGRPKKAITILEKGLAKEPENWVYVSLMSAAVAQDHGIDAVTLALKMAESSGDAAEGAASGANNEITLLFDAVPEATDANIEGVETAINWLEQIPLENRTSADTFKLTLLHTSLLALRTKKLDTNGDGFISPAELLVLVDTDAEAIVQSLADAAASLADGGDTSSVTSAAALEQITKIQSELDAQDGESTAERLRQYLGKS